jgi:hypothetical protein
MNRAAIDLLRVLVEAASAPGMEGPLRMENAAAAVSTSGASARVHMFVRDVTDRYISARRLRSAAVTAMAA